MTNAVPVTDDEINRVHIPPRPKTLELIGNETKKEYPSIAVIGKAIGEDVGLSAAVLQVINSPGYYLPNTITNIQQAVNLLGVKRVERVVTVVAMKCAISGNLNLDQFWDNATEIATLGSHISNQLHSVDQDDTYTFGLFQNCGIPLMMQAFENYEETLAEMEKTNAYPITEVERNRYKFSHADVGYRLLQRWFLPEYLCDAVYFNYHHFDELIENSRIDSSTLSLLAILRLSQDISSELHNSLNRRFNEEWERIRPKVLDYMNLDEHDYAELKEDAIDELTADD
ncbi:HDOD domain-containing protein [Pleionea sp. CnH1-48]|uniref:HDOD domain-containing protein n=1 Tax=Pleionea sp. CnH1-48 TaxID=2954494 RepID=UPI00209786C4|nr:HDOD domain-containing protein [Pleionea sp. CnH1-48]MCO7224194.1 HDOD domain-containing protein [Pleionea sp. CnH1-48]